MSYKAGELYVAKGYEEDITPRVVAKLPHSCDEWVIGGADEVRLLIADLQAALDKLDQGK